MFKRGAGHGDFQFNNGLVVWSPCFLGPLNDVITIHKETLWTCWWHTSVGIMAWHWYYCFKLIAIGLRNYAMRDIFWFPGGLLSRWEKGSCVQLCFSCKFDSNPIMEGRRLRLWVLITVIRGRSDYWFIRIYFCILPIITNFHFILDQ